MGAKINIKRLVYLLERFGVSAPSSAIVLEVRVAIEKKQSIGWEEKVVEGSSSMREERGC